jgi:nucleoside-diphosphate-sugar epimerase
MTRRAVLVTGSGGLIGSILRRHLGVEFELRGFDRRPGSPTDVAGDVRDIDALERACRGVNAVVHLAADHRVEAPWERVLEDNIGGTYAVFEAACRAGVPQVVFASSNHVVGLYEPDWRADDAADRTVTVGADAPLRPDSLYGVSKIFGEALARLYHEREGLRVICLRFGSVLPEDDPWLAAQRLPGPPEAAFRRLRATWLSQRDCAELVAAALRSEVGWAVVYGVSANHHRFWDLTPGRELLGFTPRDAAPDEPPTNA